jgi:glycosyltransferase involved in cell wall biosynthesis
MVLFVHNRYRTTGGEERVVEDLAWLARERLGMPAEVLARESAGLSRFKAAAGLLRGGVSPAEVASAVRRSGAEIVHAHNLHPTLGWRALAAARAEGARVVLHLHQYRLVCAVGVCFTEGRECTRCHGRNTLPGLTHNCRGSVAEAGSYALALAMWQPRTASLADVVLVPSRFALQRLRELGAPLDWGRVRVLPPPLRPRAAPSPPDSGSPAAPSAEPFPSALPERYALVVARLAPEKGIDVAIEACARAGIALVVAGDGPERAALQQAARTARGEVRFLGRVADERLTQLRAGAAIALAPSRSAETFGLALAEAMGAGVPVAGSRVGALPELLAPDECVAPGEAQELAEAITRLAGDRDAGERARARIAAICGPEVVAGGLRAAYEQAGARAEKP